MAQEAITEIDMDVFSRRVGPYFSWLESRIESGWEQSDTVQKDVLKEVKYLATTMRARFILGVSKEDFTKEVQRTLELFDLAAEAFPQESDEVESKLKHFCKGISEELGPQFLPTEYQLPRPPEPPEPHPMPGPEPLPEPEPEPQPEPQPLEPEEEKKSIVQKITKAKPRVKKIKIEQPIETQQTEIIEKAPKVRKEVKKTETLEKAPKAKTPKAEPKAQKAGKKTKGKGLFLIRWVKEFIYGKD